MISKVGEVFKEIIDYHQHYVITERRFLDDTAIPTKYYSVGSIDGVNNEQSLKNIIQCLFERAQKRFMPDAKAILKEKGKDSLKEYMENMKGELLKTLNAIDHSSYFTAQEVPFSRLKEVLDGKDYNAMTEAVQKAIGIDQLQMILKDETERGMEAFAASCPNYIIEFAEEIAGEGFGLPDVIINEFARKLFNELTAQNIIQCTFEDFKEVCKGNNPRTPIIFRKESDVGTFVNRLLDLAGAQPGRHQWVFIASVTCNRHGKVFNADNLRKNKQRHKSAVVKEAFDTVIDAVRKKKM